jgi:drug/metabolite transporter (DMT)-like permease
MDPTKKPPSHGAIASWLLVAVIIWGANNAATKYLIGFWPPIFVGCTRFLFAGLILLGLLKWTPWLGENRPLTPELSRRLWRRNSLNFALYIATFNGAVRYTAVSHVALYLGASPLWALLWEGGFKRDGRTARRLVAAAFALGGVVFLFLPSLREGHLSLWGEFLGLTCSILWTNYGRQSRELTRELNSVEISACTFWRASVWVLPLSIWELFQKPLPLNFQLLAIQTYCILGSGVLAFALWNWALRHWSTSEVYLFNNLIPISTMAWAFFLLHEKVSANFWPAMGLVIGGVLLAQLDFGKIARGR